MNIAQPLAFGTLLRRHRIAAGLTQEELAERARISRRSIGDLERGVAHRPHKDTVALLAEALSLSPQDWSGFVAAARQLGTVRESSAAPDATSSAPFVGRTRELTLLERHLAGEGPPVLLLAGEPGIGKTRLLHEAVLRATGYGLRVLQGGCQRCGGQEHYAPLLGALEHHIRRQPRTQLHAELHGCAWLVRLLPELAEGPVEPLPAWTLPPEQERRLMFKAVARFLANVAGPAGTLLVLDDLQWAGPDALDLVATLARSAPEVPLRIIGAYRDTEMQPPDPLSVTLADLAQAGLVVRHLLGPLAPQEAAQLLEGLLEGLDDGRTVLRKRLLQRAGGVPFFVVSCVQGLRSGSLGTGAGVGSREREGVPWDLAHTIRQRLATLPEAARELLGAAAVVGRVVPRMVLVGVATQPEREVLAALEAACHARLLEEEEGDVYHFAHDVIREVIEADLGAARRTMLHRGVAEMLEAGPDEPPLELLAYHYARSGVQDKAVLYLERAGDHALAQRAHAAAEGYYQDVVTRLDGLGRAQDAAGAREKLGQVLFTMGRYDAALEELERAAATYRAIGKLERLGRIMAHIGRVHAARITGEEGVRRLQPLVESLEASGAAHGLAMLCTALAHLFYSTSRFSEQLAAAERAVDLARAVGDDHVLAEAEGWSGRAFFQMGRDAEARQVLQEACQVAEAAGDLVSLRRALLTLVEVYRDGGELDMARLYVERALEVAQRQGDPAQIAFLTSHRGTIAIFTGHWDEARMDCERALAVSQQLGTSWVAPYAPLALGHLCMAEGQWEAASRYLEEAAKIRSRYLHARRRAQWLLAGRDLLDGQPAAARARLIPLLDRPGLQEQPVTLLLPMLAWAHLELGDVAVAAEMVKQAIARAEAQHHRLALVDALWVQAMVATRQGCWAEAARALAEGLALAQRMPYPYAEARLLHIYGLLHAGKGKLEPARERLEAALAIFRRLGARKDVERTAQAIADLGQRAAEPAALSHGP
jgi:tetratricopeptide (TPR) repeat protein/transcriptional regulator with XRE-family HTH domain